MLRRSISSVDQAIEGPGRLAWEPLEDARRAAWHRGCSSPEHPQEEPRMLRLLTAALFVTATATAPGTARADVGGRPGTVTAYELAGPGGVDGQDTLPTPH